MSLPDNLQRLKAIVSRDGWDPESRLQVEDLEKQFRQAVMKTELAEHPVIKSYVQYLNTEIARIKEILSEDESLDEKQRTTYVERKKACRDFLAHFTADTKLLEDTINHLLDVATHS